MSRITDPLSSAAGHTTESNLPGHVCPFCGLTREVTDHFDPASPCPRCTLPDTASTRNATRLRVGPWFVRQVRNPWAPGMRFETLLALIKRGQVTRDSIVRGPTTQQLWKRAADIKGLSREFGLCHSCGTEISTQAATCPQCNRLQEPPGNPDALIEARDFNTPASAAQPAPKEPKAAPQPVDEPAPFEMVSAVNVDPDDLMAVTEDQAELARQITSRPPVKDKPQLRPRQEGAEDALLTPQELAAAFQLDFTPTDQTGKRSKRKLTAVISVLLLGAAAFFYFRPDVREKTGAWGEQTVGSVKEFITSRTAPANPAPVAPKAPVKHDAVNVVPPAERAPVPAAVADQLPKQIETPAPPKVDPIKQEPQVANDKVAQDAPPAPLAVPAPIEVPKVVETPKPAEAVKPAEAPKATDARPPYDQAKELWRRAIDAEANQDFLEAVNCYEQIKKLPSDVQPWGLEVRLEQARKLTK